MSANCQSIQRYYTGSSKRIFTNLDAWLVLVSIRGIMSIYSKATFALSILWTLMKEKS